jgi:hypothetical protein
MAGELIATPSTSASICILFHFYTLSHLVPVLMTAWYNIWTGANVYILADNTHAMLVVMKGGPLARKAT